MKIRASPSTRVVPAGYGSLTMGWLALVSGLVAAICTALPGAALYVAMALGVVALGAGLVGYRRRGDAGAARLAGASGIFLGLASLLFAAARYGLILAAVQRIERLL